MKITLYKNVAESNKLNKSSSLTQIVELDGALRNASSIIQPAILIQILPDTDYVLDNNTTDVLDNELDEVVYFKKDKLLECNYCYIPDFKRYYFIDNITSVNSQLWLLDMSVDVLMTYKDKILDLNAFVTRNEFTFNNKIKDDLASFYYDKEVTEITPESGALVNTTFNVNPNDNDRCVVLTTITPRINQQLTDVIPPALSELPIIGNKVYTELFTNITYALKPYDLRQLSSVLLDNDNLVSFVKSLIYLPFNPVTYIDNVGVVCGQEDVGTVKGSLLSSKISDYLVVADFQIVSTPSSFLDYNPFTQYELYLPYNGWITLNPDLVLNHRLIVYYVINYEDGTSNVNVYDKSESRLIYSGSSQIGVKLPINTTNNTELTTQRNANGLNLTLGLVSSALSVGTGALTMNPVAAAGGILSAGKSIASYINNQSMQFEKAQSTFSSGVAGLYAPQVVKLRKTKLKLRNYDDNYFKLHGRPLNEYKKLSDLTGFTTIGNVHLEGFDTATSTEITSIDTLLKEGIII